MLLRFHLLDVGLLANSDLRQLRAVIVFGGIRALCGRVVAAFLIDGEEPVEHSDGTGGTQGDLFVGGHDIDRGALQFGAFHLAGNRALPDQVVELLLIVIERAGDLLRCALEAGRTNGFVRFLRVLGFRRIDARRGRHVFGAIFLADHGACFGNAFGRHGDAVSTHVSDEADRLAADVHAFVEALRDAHGVLGIEAQLARGFHLQRRGDERRRRIALDRLALHRTDGEFLRIDQIDSTLGLGFVVDAEFFDLLAVQIGEMRAEGAGRCADVRIDGPVFDRIERFDLLLAFHHEAQRHGLHAPGRARARQLAPQNRRQREAHQIVQRAAGQIGVHQFGVDLARMLDGFQNGRFGDGIERHALDLDVFAQCLLLLEHFQHMPGNGLTFAVRVGGEDELVGAFDGIDDVLDALLGLGVHFPGHGEVVVRLHRPILGRQVADMAEARQHLVARAKVLVDRLHLTGGLNNQDVHGVGDASSSSAQTTALWLHIY